MRVLYVDQFGKTAGRDSLAQCEYIHNNEDIDMTVFLSDNTEIRADKKYNVHIVKGFHGAYEGNIINKAFNYIKSLIKLKKFIKKEQFDIVHLQWFSLPWIEWIYVQCLRKYSKIVITVHDVIPFNNRPLEMKYLDKIYARADQLLLHTEYSKQQFSKYYKAKTPINIITQGFCLKADYKKIDKKKAKDHFGIPEEAIVVLYYGTIRKSKGLDYLIKAVSKAIRENNKIVLLAGGAFQRIDPKTYEKLLNDNLNKSNYYTNFNFIPMQEEPYYFSAADMICLPYLEITQSGVAQIGLMYDLPMIASDIGDMKAVIRPGINGELVKPRDIDGLANAILKLANNESLRETYSQGSYILSKTEFSVEVKGHKVADSYRNLIRLSKQR